MLQTGSGSSFRRRCRLTLERGLCLTASYSRPAKRAAIRRRPSPEQGTALETLGHAIEYLVDSRLSVIDEPATLADTEAVEILMRLSRSVFAECSEVVPLRRKLRRWLTGLWIDDPHDLKQPVD